MCPPLGAHRQHVISRPHLVIGPDPCPAWTAAATQSTVECERLCVHDDDYVPAIFPAIFPAMVSDDGRDVIMTPAKIMLCCETTCSPSTTSAFK